MIRNCPVAGIDVGKETFWLAILTPDGSEFIRPTKMDNNRNGLEDLILKLEKAKEVFGERPKILLESTGHYSENFLAFLIRKDYQAFLINPLQSHSIKSSGIRKAKTDKLDCVDIAKLYFMIDLKEYVKPDEYTYDLKILTRAYAKFIEEKTSLKNQIHKVLDESLPGYAKIFKDVASSTSLEVLSNYGSPDLLLNADRYELINLIKMSSRRSCKDAEHKYELLLSCAKDAKETGVAAKSLFTMITFLSDELKYKKQQIDRLGNQIRQLSIDIPAVELLESIPGIGERLAPIFAAEIGDISRFKTAKQLIAYCGIDPSVKQSGSFTGTKNKFTKRGSPHLRYALYLAAIVSLKHKNGNYTNIILYDYYEKKIQSKAKKQAIGAVMNKLVRIIFSVLKNKRKYIPITPERQIEIHKHHLEAVA